MVAYIVERIDAVSVSGVPALAGMDLMSPFVWPAPEGGYRMMLRAVPDPMGSTDPSGIIYSGGSIDGLAFAMDGKPAIAPGPDQFDAAGVEDPTVIVGHGRLLIYYTGVSADRQGSLLVATGADERHLAKRAVALKAPPGEGNIKEATIVQTPAGDWRLFYEYAANEASRIGMASASDLLGEWTPLPDIIPVREDSWDNWHLSTGPIVQIGGHDPVMFYNGATHDARWRIGWVSFSADFSAVTGRGLEPVLLPPPAADRSATDIAFAASAIVEGDGVSLWYSLEDRKLMRARIRAYG